MDTATCILAGAAVLQAVATIVLVCITRAYAKSAADGVTTMKRQSRDAKIALSVQVQQVKVLALQVRLNSLPIAGASSTTVANESGLLASEAKKLADLMGFLDLGLQEEFEELNQQKKGTGADSQPPA